MIVIGQISTGAHLCDFVHFDYEDTVLRASSHSGSDRVLGFKWGEARRHSGWK